MTKFIVAPSRSALATSFLAFLYICLPTASFIIPKVTSRAEKIKFNPSVTSGTAEALFRRGGGSSFLEGHGSSDVDFDYTDDDDIEKEVEVDIITGAREIGAAKLAKPMSKFPMNDEEREQQSKSYFLSSVLWLSLALDTVLNKKKRSLLFSGASNVGGRIIASNVVPTFSLASGFVLSAGVAFLLSCDLKDNSFTHCSAEMNGSEFNEKVRKRLHIFLATFGIVNVGANLNSFSAPFLGAGGGAINFYNALIAVNGWSKEVGGGQKNFVMQVIGGFKSMINSLVTSFDSGENPGFSRRISSAVYFLGSVIAILRSINLISNVLVPHYMKCYTAGTMAVSSVEEMRRIGLQWAAIARFLLAGGISLTLKEATERGKLGTGLARALNWLVFMCAAGVGLSAFFGVGGETVLRDALKLLFLAAVAGYNIATDILKS